MPIQFETLAAQPCRVDCEHTTATTCETAAEVQARLARQEDARLASIAGVMDERHRARLAERRSMYNSGEAERLAEQLIDRLVEGASPTEARRLLCIARNALTTRIHAAIIAEYDAEVAANPGASFAQMAGRERPGKGKGLFTTEGALAIRDELSRKRPVDGAKEAVKGVPKLEVAAAGGCKALFDLGAQGVTLRIVGEQSNG